MADTVRVATLNVAGHDERAPASRLAAFIRDALSGTRSPDVLCFQNLALADRASARAALADAFELVDDGAAAPTRTCVALALRRSTVSRAAAPEVTPLAAAPGRALLSCAATLAGGRRALFATAHFTGGGGIGGHRGEPGSAGDAAARARSAQREQVFALLRGALAGGAELVAFGGTVNLREEELPPAALARAGLLDAWAAAGAEKGLRFTFDLKSNDNRARERGHAARYRFDRVWYGARGAAVSVPDEGGVDSIVVQRPNAPPPGMWAARSFRLLGTRRIVDGEGRGLFPSDHFGVSVELVPSSSSALASEAADAMADAEAATAVSDFFVSRDYATASLRFGAGDECEQRFDCLQAASTDFDLTGQILWPAARLLSHFIVARLRERLAGEDVLELGAGCGLAGLVASKFGARSVTLTDNEPEVLALLERNLKHVAAGVAGRVFDLSWGDEGAHARLAEACGRAKWRVVIAADVVYWRESIEPLATSIAALLDPLGTCYLGYFERVSKNTQLLEAALASRGLSVRRTPADEFLWRRGAGGAHELPSNLAVDLDRMCVYTISFGKSVEQTL